MRRYRYRFVLVAVSLCAVAPLDAPAARAMRSAKVSISTARPSASTLNPTHVEVPLGAEDYQSPEPTGNVTVKDNGVTIGTAVPGNCSGYPCRTFRYTFEAGNHSLVAYYSGDDQFSPVQSEPSVFTLHKILIIDALASDAPRAGADGVPPTVGSDRAITFTATFRTYYDHYVPTKQPAGVVSFYDADDNDRVIGSAPIKNWSATVTTTLPAESARGNGRHTIIASYDGDPNFEGHLLRQSVANVRVVDPSTGSSAPTPSNRTSPTTRVSNPDRATTEPNTGATRVDTATSGIADQPPTATEAAHEVRSAPRDRRETRAARSQPAGDSPTSSVAPEVGVTSLAVMAAIAAGLLRRRSRRAPTA